jgi:hypothetical protein
MILIVLAAAAGLTVPLPPTAPRAEPMPNLYSSPAHCRDAPYHVVDRFGRPVTRRLGDLPDATAQLLVDRKVDGCRVVTVMRSGERAPVDQPNPPASQYRMLPLKPAPPR